MAVEVKPSSLARRMAPKKVIEKLVTQKLTVNRTAVTMLARSVPMGERTLTSIAIKVINDYKKKFRSERRQGGSIREATEEALAGKAKMVQRVRDSVTVEITEEIKSQYHGEFYEWLPSSANEPDPEHQLNYGKRFQLGKGDRNGDDPGDRFGCQCGMRILVNESRLSLS